MATTITGRIVLREAQETGYKMWLGRLLNKLVREHIMPYLDVKFETDDAGNGPGNVLLLDQDGYVPLENLSGIDAENLANGAVTNDKIADGAVKEAKLAPNAVTMDKIATYAVSGSKIAPAAVATNKIVDEAVTEAKISDLAVTEAKIATAAVTNDKIADGAVTEAKLANVAAVFVGGIAMSKIKANEISNLAGDAPPAITGGYTYVTTLYYTSPGTHQFVKANYPWLRAMRIKVQAAGGSGGGINGTVGGRSGGGGGGYAERFYTDIEQLPSSAPITVGAGPAGTTGDGEQGGESAFGTSGDAWHTSATGGGGGSAQEGGYKGTGTVGDILRDGQGGAIGARDTNIAPATRLWSGQGGSSPMGGGGRGWGPMDAARDGDAGGRYGGGGSGALLNTSSGSRVGGPGANGIVVLELYA
jgi:hypothetical protein